MHQSTLNLSMQNCAPTSLKSRSQIARVVTESWGAINLYCAACDSNSLSQSPCNTKAVDFSCNLCNNAYQLKSSRVWNEHRIPDAGYYAMIESIASDRTPNLLVLQYSSSWMVHNLLLIPRYFFTQAAVQQRKPLGPTARRAGWIGCNILLSAIAPVGKLRIVNNGVVTHREEIRKQYARLRPLSTLDSGLRGWTLDVLRVIQQLKKQQFSLRDIYTAEAEFSALHPNNANIRPKIRQQLQVLRDLGFVSFKGKGEYELRL